MNNFAQKKKITRLDVNLCNKNQNKLIKKAGQKLQLEKNAGQKYSSYIASPPLK